MANISNKPLVFRKHGKEPEILLYFDVVCQNNALIYKESDGSYTYDIEENQSSKFQIIVECDEFYGEQYSRQYYEEIELLFFERLFDLKNHIPINYNKFLEYHINYYVNQDGEFEDFTHWLRMSLIEIKKTFIEIGHNNRFKWKISKDEIEVHIQTIEKWINEKKALPPKHTETKTKQEIPKKYIANEYAIAYIFDLYTSGKQIPINRTDGGYNKKELIQQGFKLYQFDLKKDTFYRAVKHVANFDLNKPQKLAHISQNWIEVVKTLSKDWNKTEKYLKEKKLIGE